MKELHRPKQRYHVSLDSGAKGLDPCGSLAEHVDILVAVDIVVAHVVRECVGGGVEFWPVKW